MGRIGTNQDSGSPPRHDRIPSWSGDPESAAGGESPPARGFFREREAWSTLEDAVIEPLVLGKGPDEPIRVWVAETGTGETAYAVAMLLLERTAAAHKRCPVQVFATDADAGVLAYARAGRYPSHVVRHVGSMRLRFFHAEGESGSHVVVPSVRDVVYFGTHALGEGKPFHRMDLVCCLADLRALLPAERRAHALRNLGAAARPGGYLFFGAPTTLAGGAPMAAVSQRWGIQRSLGARPQRPTAVAAIFDSAARLVWARVTGAGARGLAPLETGLRLVEFGARFGDDLLGGDALGVMNGLAPGDREVRGEDGRPYLRRVSPYPGGVMVTLSHGAHDPDLTADFERLANLRARQWALLHETLRIANRSPSLTEALRESLEAVCSTLEWPLGHAWLKDDEGDEFVDAGLWWTHSTRAFARFARASRRLRFTAGPTSLGSVAASGAPLWVPDVTADAQLCRSAEEVVAGGLAGALLVPIRQEGETLGVLEFFTTQSTAPPRAIIDGLAEIGVQLGVVREREQSHRRLRVLASERLLAEQRERNKLAKDLHDDLGQVLALARMGVEGLHAAMPSQEASIDRICGLLTQANETVRTLSFRLSPPVLRELGLVAALEWLTESLPLPSAMRIEVRSRAGDLGWLSESDRVILFRSARELMINAVKHSAARTVSVEVHRSKTFLLISVADDGVGLAEADSAATDGFGLTSVREALGLAGGRLSLAARAGGGVRATIRFPIPAKENPR